MVLADPEYRERLECAGNGFSLFSGSGQLIGCGGIGIYWTGVGEAWFVLTQQVDQYRFSFHRTVVRTMQEIIYTQNLHRIQGTIRCGDARAVRWAERLGFRFEGTMWGYGPDGSNYWRFALLIREED